MPKLAERYPGVGPWEWEAHPEWLSRVQCRMVAEDEGQDIKMAQAAEAAQEAAQETRA